MVGVHSGQVISTGPVVGGAIMLGFVVLFGIIFLYAFYFRGKRVQRSTFPEILPANGLKVPIVGVKTQGNFKWDTLFPSIVFFEDRLEYNRLLLGVKLAYSEIKSVDFHRRWFSKSLGTIDINNGSLNLDMGGAEASCAMLYFFKRKNIPLSQNALAYLSK